MIGAGKLRIPSLTGANGEFDELIKNQHLRSPITIQINRVPFST